LALDQQDLFTASQIIHLKPLVGQAVYRRFVAANPFVARFYPNFHVPSTGRIGSRSSRLVARFKGQAESAMAVPSAFVEWVCRGAYRAYLMRRAAGWQSPEQVRLEPDCLKLHTKSHRRSVLARFEHAVHAALE
jgi:hypothetical protein